MAEVWLCSLKWIDFLFKTTWRKWLRLQKWLITEGQNVPDFLTSTKPSVMVRNAPWPKSPTMSTSDAIYALLLLLCTKVCFKFLSVMALRFPLGLYLSSISSSASYKQLAQLCCQWKSVNNGMKTTFTVIISIILSKRLEPLQKKACIYFSFLSVPLLLLFFQDIFIRTEVLGLLTK